MHFVCFILIIEKAAVEDSQDTKYSKERPAYYKNKRFYISYLLKKNSNQFLKSIVFCIFNVYVAAF